MEQFNGDKRTKEYKEWKAKFDSQSEGLGDTIEKITEATGIKKAVKFIAGEDCGCDERKAKLNELFRYNRPECFTEDEYNYLMDRFNENANVITPVHQKKMLAIYNRVFHTNKQPTSCGRCFAAVWGDLKVLLNQYN